MRSDARTWLYQQPLDIYRSIIFDGFDRMRALTYSVSAQMIVRMLDRYSFEMFECVFGYEGGLRRFADVVAFQQFLINQVRDCALQLEDERQRVIFERVHDGRARFYVVKDNIAHAKLYLLEADDPERRPSDSGIGQSV